MYKVFINEVLVFFTEKKSSLADFISIEFKELDLNELYQETQKNPSAKINVICDKLEEDWISFLLNFQVRKAAGGVVVNEKQEYLWIYRFGKWDLPKGHIEKGESKRIAAIREVEEECGIFGLSIDKKLLTTYHVFIDKKKFIFKVTYWFSMHTISNGQKLVPQQEEGITDVCFKSVIASKKCLENSYENIKLLMEDFLENM